MLSMGVIIVPGWPHRKLRNRVGGKRVGGRKFYADSILDATLVRSGRSAQRLYCQPIRNFVSTVVFSG
ncbi:MAG: hypothetical protein P4L92_12620 [Rudaea sp.]|nr:hypothetical protein [Rudaea sp.]